VARPAAAAAVQAPAAEVLPAHRESVARVAVVLARQEQAVAVPQAPAAWPVAVLLESAAQAVAARPARQELPAVAVAQRVARVLPARWAWAAAEAATITTKTARTSIRTPRGK
jgi:hypothetical protein